MSAAWLRGEQADAVVAEVEAAMLAFNQAQLGPQAAQRYVLARYATQGDLLAGLVAWSYWNCLYIDQLWVHEAARGRGLGRALMDEAEALALRLGLDGLRVETFSFAAPDFYRRLGYQEYGHLHGMPRGVGRHYLCKWLRDAPAARA
jgi:GNAT superfamily N-acetyltransferase